MKMLQVRPEFSTLSIIRALWNRKWFIVLFWCLGTGAVTGIVFRLQPIYSASAVILVESQQIPESFVTATVQTPLEARLDTLKQQVLSRDRLSGLIEAFNLYPKERARLTKEEVLRIMREDVAINLVRGWSSRGPGAFEISYRAPRATVAADVANRVGMFFINENLRQRTGEAVATSEFLNQQLAEAEQRLREHEALLKEFKLSHNGELPQQEGALLASMSQSRTELLGIQEAIGRAQQNKLILEGSSSYAQALLDERRRAIRRPPVSAPAPRAETPAAPVQPTELERAELQLSALRARYYDSHPDVQRMVQEVERIKKDEAAHPRPQQAATAPVTPVNPPADPAPAAAAEPDVSLVSESIRIDEIRGQIQLLTREIQSLESRRQRVLEDIRETQTRIRAIPVREQQLASITRDYETCKTNYDSLLNKKLAADVAANMERWQKSQKFVMLDQARVPQKPTRPRRILLISVGTVFSLILGAALAFTLQLKENVLLGEWELPAGTPVLGRVPGLKLSQPLV